MYHPLPARALSMNIHRVFNDRGGVDLSKARCRLVDTGDRVKASNSKAKIKSRSGSCAPASGTIKPIIPAGVADATRRILLAVMQGVVYSWPGTMETERRL